CHATPMRRAIEAGVERALATKNRRKGMQDYPPVELRAMFRAGHSQFWEVADKAGILSRMGVTLSYLEGTDDPRIAEEAPFAGKIDMICGNHITPYIWVTRGAPIVCMVSHSYSYQKR